LNVVTLENYELQDASTGGRLQDLNFMLAAGEAWALSAADADQEHLLASALATLIPPVSGEYLFLDEALDFSDYQKLLRVKKQIGYFGPDAALVSNLTVRQNLLLSRAYFENRLDLDLDDNIKALCKNFQLHEKLDLRPTALSPLDIRAAIMTREITKPLKLLIMDGPDDLLGHPGAKKLVAEVEKRVTAGLPLVLFCENKELTARLTNRALRLTPGGLQG
jgi:ABC-type lipoprotein export system ATPase subunit